MEDDILLILNLIRSNPFIQIILLTSLACFLLALWKEIRAVRRKRRHEKAIFACPLECAREAFPDDYVRRDPKPGLFSSSRSYRNARFSEDYNDLLFEDIYSDLPNPSDSRQMK